jgi:hypothetical protein
VGQLFNGFQPAWAFEAAPGAALAPGLTIVPFDPDQDHNAHADAPARL